MDSSKDINSDIALKSMNSNGESIQENKVEEEVKNE